MTDQGQLVTKGKIAQGQSTLNDFQGAKFNNQADLRGATITTSDTQTLSQLISQIGQQQSSNNDTLYKSVSDVLANSQAQSNSFIDALKNVTSGLSNTTGALNTDLSSVLSQANGANAAGALSSQTGGQSLLVKPLLWIGLALAGVLAIFFFRK